MEKIIDDSESRRRAEEIYSRRNGINIETNKKKYFSIYKFLFQLLVLINLAISFVVYKNKDFIFSKDFSKQINDFYNINISEKINAFFEEDLGEKENKETNIIENEVENQVQNNIISKEIKQENTEIKELNSIDNIKESYSFIKPIEGTITSFFGNRESKNNEISGFHSGIDISAVQGTKILSSITGKVIQVSDKGNYGNHLKIQEDNITTLYAHCKCIYVKEGDDVKQGQEIAEVGSTGKSTGSHLHFEIRCNDEFLNPSEYINF